MRRAAAALVTATTLSATLAFGQPPGTEVMTLDQLQTAIIAKLDSLVPKEERVERVSQAATRAPENAPSARQTGATSAASSAASLVNRPGFTELVALALDNDLVTTGDGFVTLDLNAFAMLALAKPSVLDRQTQYQDYGWLRKLGGAVTLGGKGETFDRDGDGKADAALQSERLNDIVTWEVRYRLAGSRDRRDKKNFEKYVTPKESPTEGGVDGLSLDYDAALNRFLLDHRERIISRDAQGQTSAYRAEVVNALLSSPDVQDELLAAALLRQELLIRIEKANTEIDHSALWTLVCSGTSRSDDKYGPDKFNIGLRGVFRLGGWDSTVNADWTRLEGIQGRPDGEMVKVGVGASALWFKGSQMSKEGISASFSAGIEKYRNIPDAKHDLIALAQFKLELPIRKGVSIPATVTWASHSDLFSDKDVVRGHVGVQVDFSKLHEGS